MFLVHLTFVCFNIELVEEVVARKSGSGLPSFLLISELPFQYAGPILLESEQFKVKRVS